MVENFLSNFPDTIKVLITAILPVLELRAAIPLGIGLGISPLKTFLISFIGSMLPVPFIYFLLRPLLNWFKKSAFFKKHIEAFEEKTIRKSGKIQKYGAIGLILFVGIPLPGTGIWTGTFAAVLLDVRFKWAFPAILLGDFIAGMLVLALSSGVSTMVR